MHLRKPHHDQGHAIRRCREALRKRGIQATHSQWASVTTAGAFWASARATAIIATASTAAGIINFLDVVP